MATTTALLFPIKAETSSYDRGMIAAERTAAKTAASIVRAWQKASKDQQTATQQSIIAMERSYSDFGNKMKSQMIGIGAGIFSVAAVKQVVQMADDYAVLQQRIRTATAATGDFTKVSKDLYEISQRSGVRLQDSVEVFQRLSMSARELGASNSDIIKLADTVQKLGIMSGASTTAMSAGLMQFSQGMSAGVLRAEEFNSIVENLPAVADRIAQGFGVSKGQLRQMVIDGKVLSKDVFDALMKQSAEINAQFDSMPASIGRSTTMLTNALSRMIGELDKASGLTAGLSENFQGMAKWAEATAGFIAAWREPEWLSRLRLLQNFNTKEHGGALLSGAMGLAAPFVSGRATGAHSISLDSIGALAQLAGVTGDALLNRAPGVAGGAAKPLPPLAATPDEEAKKQAEKYADFLASLKEQNRELTLQTQHRKDLAGIAKIEYDAAKSIGRKLTAQEKTAIHRLAVEQQQLKATLDGQQKAEAAAKAQAEHVEALKRRYQDITMHLESQIAYQQTLNSEGEAGAHIAYRRLELEKQIRDLSPEQQAVARAKLEQVMALEKNKALQDIWKSLRQQNEELQLSIENRRQEIPLLQLIRELEEKGLATAEARAQAESMMRENLAKRSELAVADYTRNMSDQTEDMIVQEQQARLIANHQEDIAAILGAEYQIQKQLKDIGGDRSLQLSDQQRKEIAIHALRQQQLRDMQRGRDLMDSLKTEQQKYNELVSELDRLWRNGALSVSAYHKLLLQANPQFKALRDTANEIGRSFENAFTSLTIQGQKFSDVMKSLKNDLLMIAEKKLIFEPLEKGFSALLEKLFPTGTPGGTTPQGTTAGGSNTSVWQQLAQAFGFGGAGNNAGAPPLLGQPPSSGQWWSPNNGLSWLPGAGPAYTPGGNGPDPRLGGNMAGIPIPLPVYVVNWPPTVLAGGYNSPMWNPMSGGPVGVPMSGGGGGGGLPTFGGGLAQPGGSGASAGWSSIADRYDQLGMPVQAAMARNIANGSMNGGGLSNMARNMSWSNFSNNIWNNTAGLPSSLTGLMNLQSGPGPVEQQELSGYEMYNQLYDARRNAELSNPYRPSGAGGNWMGAAPNNYNLPSASSVYGPGLDWVSGGLTGSIGGKSYGTDTQMISIRSGPGSPYYPLGAGIDPLRSNLFNPQSSSYLWANERGYSITPAGGIGIPPGYIPVSGGPTISLPPTPGGAYGYGAGYTPVNSGSMTDYLARTLYGWTQGGTGNAPANSWGPNYNQAQMMANPPAGLVAQGGRWIDPVTGMDFTPNPYVRKYASGGNPPVGIPSLVGENGPELIVPRSAATVIPNDAIGGSDLNVQVINNNGSAITPQVTRGPDGKQVLKVIVDHLANDLKGGGQFSQALQRNLGVRRRGFARG